MAKLNSKQVKDSFIAAKSWSAAQETRRAPTIAPTRVGRTRESIVQQAFGDVVAKLGVDVDKFERLRTEQQAASLRAVEAQKAGALKNATLFQTDVLRGLKDRRNVLETLPAKPPGPFFVTLDAPFLIWANHPSILGDSHIEPWNSRT